LLLVPPGRMNALERLAGVLRRLAVGGHHDAADEAGRDRRGHRRSARVDLGREALLLVFNRRARAAVATTKRPMKPGRGAADSNTASVM